MPALVRLHGRLVDGLDVASAGELQVALDAGMRPRARSVSPGPARRRPSCAQAVAAGVLVNVESSARSTLLATHRAARSACRRAWRCASTPTSS